MTQYMTAVFWFGKTLTPKTWAGVVITLFILYSYRYGMELDKSILHLHQILKGRQYR